MCAFLLLCAQGSPIQAQTGSITCQNFGGQYFVCTMTVSGSTAEISNVLWTGIWGQVFPKGNQFSVTPGSDDCGKVFHIKGEAYQNVAGTYTRIATANISHRFTCPSQTPGDNSPRPPETPPPRPQSLVKVSGDEQQGPVGSALDEPFVIKVSDQNGNPLAGATVTFAVTAGGGTLSIESATTDANGTVATKLTLGAQPGTNTVVATVSGLDPVTFTVTGLAIARTMEKVAGDQQQGAAGAELDEPLTIRVSDQNGNPLAGATVTFAIAGGGGTLSAHTTTTDENGKVSATLTLGAQPGTNTVVATLSDMDPVTFTATGLAIARTMEKVAGDQQQGAAGAGLSDPFAVAVKDQNGNPLAGATVTFAVATGTGTLSARTATTDSSGRAATTLTLGARPGANTVVARVSDLEPVTFTATGKNHPDFNRDGIVDFTDFVLFAGWFGLRSGDEGYDTWFDLDKNGTIGFSDFLIFAHAFGTNPLSG